MALPTMGAVKHVLLAKFKDDVPQERLTARQGLRQPPLPHLAHEVLPLPPLPHLAHEVLPLPDASCKSEYGQQPWNRVSVAPYQRKEKDGEDKDEAEPGIRVLACCWGPGKPATTFVFLDFTGEMVDLLYAGSLSIRGHAVTEQQRKKNDQQRVLKFVTDHQPQVVCLGGANLSCRQLKDELYEVEMEQ